MEPESGEAMMATGYTAATQGTLMQRERVVLMTFFYRMRIGLQLSLTGLLALVLTACGGGGTASISNNINVNNNAPSLSIVSIQPATPTAGQQVAFSANGQGTGTVTYVWSFGDGQTSNQLAGSSGASVTHVYSTPGNYTISVTLTDSTGKTATASSSITVSTPSLTASISSISMSNPQAFTTVNFIGTAQGVGTLVYLWDFGDGSGVVSGSNVSHSYSSVGTFTVTLSVSDVYGNAVTTTSSVVVQAPSSVPATTATITVPTGTLFAGVPLSLSSTVQNGLGPFTYAWSFGDGQTSSGTSSQQTFVSSTQNTYAKAGTYTVTLTITNGAGTTTTVTNTVTVVNPPAPSNVTILSSYGLQPTLVNFAVAAIGVAPYTYVWNFGDTITAGTDPKNPLTSATIAHQYASTGTYNVQVTITDSLGQSTTASATVSVSSSGLSLLAGSVGGAGAVDATGTAARFNGPYGTAMDSAGNLYIVDKISSTIRKMTAAGVVTTLAGTAGQTGNVDATGSAARFNQPTGLAIDASGTLYVADSGNNTIRKVSPTGVVTTLAGIAGTSGATDSASATSATFNDPLAVAVDSSGNVYVADTGNYTVRKISTSGAVTTLAGTAGTPGSQDGTGSAALFNSPVGLALDGQGNLYAADFSNYTVRKISPAGVVTTIAGVAGITGTTDGQGAKANFTAPDGLTYNAQAGGLYVTDGSTIRFIALTGSSIDQVTTLAGAANFTGALDGVGTSAVFNGPASISVAADGSLYVADYGNNTIRKITISQNSSSNTIYTVTTIAGMAGTSGANNGTGAAASFLAPSGIAQDSAGNLYVTDTYNHLIRMITPAGVVTTIAGSGTAGATNGVGTAASFNTPEGIVIDSAGNLYVADTGNNVIRKITVSTGTSGNVYTVSTFAGQMGVHGALNGTGSAAQFNTPTGLAIDAQGNLYVADFINYTIRKITPAGVVTTLAGSAGNLGAVDGTGTAARLNHPTGITVDSQGNVYVADCYNNTIRKITSAGVVTTIAGSGAAGSADSTTGLAAQFNHPFAITIDSAGNLYVADGNNSTIRKIVPSGTTPVTTIVGQPGQFGTTLGALPGNVMTPQGVLIASGGQLVITSGNAVLVATGF